MSKQAAAQPAPAKQPGQLSRGVVERNAGKAAKAGGAGVQRAKPESAMKTLLSRLRLAPAPQQQQPQKQPQRQPQQQPQKQPQQQQQQPQQQQQQRQQQQPEAVRSPASAPSQPRSHQPTPFKGQGSLVPSLPAGASPPASVRSASMPLRQKQPPPPQPQQQPQRDPAAAPAPPPGGKGGAPAAKGPSRSHTPALPASPPGAASPSVTPTAGRGRGVSPAASALVDSLFAKAAPTPRGRGRGSSLGDLQRRASLGRQSAASTPSQSRRSSVQPAGGGASSAFPVSPGQGPGAPLLAMQLLQSRGVRRRSPGSPSQGTRSPSLVPHSRSPSPSPLLPSSPLPALSPRATPVLKSAGAAPRPAASNHSLPLSPPRPRQQHPRSPMQLPGVDSTRQAPRRVFGPADGSSRSGSQRQSVSAHNRQQGFRGVPSSAGDEPSLDHDGFSSDTADGSGSSGAKKTSDGSSESAKAATAKPKQAASEPLETMQVQPRVPSTQLNNSSDSAAIRASPKSLAEDDLVNPLVTLPQRGSAQGSERGAPTGPHTHYPLPSLSPATLTPGNATPISSCARVSPSPTETPPGSNGIRSALELQLQAKQREIDALQARIRDSGSSPGRAQPSYRTDDESRRTTPVHSNRGDPLGSARRPSLGPALEDVSLLRGDLRELSNSLEKLKAKQRAVSEGKSYTPPSGKASFDDSSWKDNVASATQRADFELSRTLDYFNAALQQVRDGVATVENLSSLLSPDRAMGLRSFPATPLDFLEQYESRHRRDLELHERQVRTILTQSDCFLKERLWLLGREARVRRQLESTESSTSAALRRAIAEMLGYLSGRAPLEPPSTSVTPRAYTPSPPGGGFQSPGSQGQFGSFDKTPAYIPGYGCSVDYQAKSPSAAVGKRTPGGLDLPLLEAWHRDCLNGLVAVQERALWGTEEQTRNDVVQRERSERRRLADADVGEMILTLSPRSKADQRYRHPHHSYPPEDPYGPHYTSWTLPNGATTGSKPIQTPTAGGPHVAPRLSISTPAAPSGYYPSPSNLISTPPPPPHAQSYAPVVSPYNQTQFATAPQHEYMTPGEPRPPPVRPHHAPAAPFVHSAHSATKAREEVYDLVVSGERVQRLSPPPGDAAPRAAPAAAAGDRARTPASRQKVQTPLTPASGAPSPFPARTRTAPPPRASEARRRGNAHTPGEAPGVPAGKSVWQTRGDSPYVDEYGYSVTDRFVNAANANGVDAEANDFVGPHSLEFDRGAAYDSSPPHHGAGSGRKQSDRIFVGFGKESALLITPVPSKSSKSVTVVLDTGTGTTTSTYAPTTNTTTTTTVTQHASPPTVREGAARDDRYDYANRDGYPPGGRRHLSPFAGRFDPRDGDSTQFEQGSDCSRRGPQRAPPPPPSVSSSPLRSGHVVFDRPHARPFYAGAAYRYASPGRASHVSSGIFDGNVDLSARRDSIDAASSRMRKLYRS
ncbi:hypothetical protein DIPPA_27152 [Diplonema papillatum]|nr:hypothetical protein DIPPA_27152 [Diplonema papillatum]